MSILDSFLNFFQCGGEEFTCNYEQEEEEEEEDNTVKAANLQQDVLEPATPIGSSSISSPTSIYSIPSRESMNEVRQSSLNRFGRSPLFACTSSTPIRFCSFEGDGEDYNVALDKRDDSIASPRIRSDRRQFTPLVKRVNSIATATTADSNSVVEEPENLHQETSEDSSDYPVDIVAVRE